MAGSRSGSTGGVPWRLRFPLHPAPGQEGTNGFRISSLRIPPLLHHSRRHGHGIAHNGTPAHPDIHPGPGKRSICRSPLHGTNDGRPAPAAAGSGARGSPVRAERRSVRPLREPPGARRSRYGRHFGRLDRHRPGQRRPHAGADDVRRSAPGRSGRTAGAATGSHNYLNLADPAAGHRNIPTYARAVVDDLYPGVDAVFYGRDGLLEYDLIVEPGAGTSGIVLAFDDGTMAHRTGAGALVATKGRTQLVQRAPVAFARRRAGVVGQRLGRRSTRARNRGARATAHLRALRRSAGDRHLQVGRWRDLPVRGRLCVRAAGAGSVELFHLLRARTQSERTGRLRAQDHQQRTSYQTFFPGAVDPATRIVVDPRDSNHVFLSANGVLLRTLDGGSTWSQSALTGLVTFSPEADGPAFDVKTEDIQGEAFVARFNASGDVVFRTFLGGARGETIGSLALGAGGVLVTGTTPVARFPAGARRASGCAALAVRPHLPPPAAGERRGDHLRTGRQQHDADAGPQPARSARRSGGLRSGLRHRVQRLHPPRPDRPVSGRPTTPWDGADGISPCRRACSRRAPAALPPTWPTRWPACRGTTSSSRRSRRTRSPRTAMATGCPTRGRRRSA